MSKERRAKTGDGCEEGVRRNDLLFSHILPGEVETGEVFSETVGIVRDPFVEA